MLAIDATIPTKNVGIACECWNCLCQHVTCWSQQLLNCCYYGQLPTCKRHFKPSLHPLSIFHAVEKTYYLLSTSSTGYYKLYIGITDFNTKKSLRFVSLIIMHYLWSSSLRIISILLRKWRFFFYYRRWENPLHTSTIKPRLIVL